MNPQNSTLLDINRIESLLNEMGDAAADIMGSLIESFEQDIHTNIAEMRLAVDAASHDRLRRAAHGLKGSAASMGAAAVAALCLELEHIDNHSDLAQLSENIDQLESLCASSVEALYALVN